VYNVVEVGVGTDVGASRLVHWSSGDTIEVAALSVSTGDGYSGEWGFSEISREYGNRLSLFTSLYLSARSGLANC